MAKLADSGHGLQWLYPRQCRAGYVAGLSSHWADDHSVSGVSVVASRRNLSSKRFCLFSTNAHTNAHRDSNSDTNSDTNAHRDSNSDTNAHRDSNSHTYRDVNSHANGDVNSHAYADAHCDCNSHTYRDVNSHTDADQHPDAAVANADPHAPAVWLGPGLHSRAS